MKKYISCSGNPDVLSYDQKQKIADALFKIVEKYFTGIAYGYPSPRVSYLRYNVKEYTFSINSRSFSHNVEYTALVDGGYSVVDLDQFKAEVRAYLRSEGFKKVSFDFDTFKQKGDQNTGYYRSVAPVYTYKKFKAIYFAQ